jgi:hypothetical protein
MFSQCWYCEANQVAGPSEMQPASGAPAPWARRAQPPARPGRPRSSPLLLRPRSRRTGSRNQRGECARAANRRSGPRARPRHELATSSGVATARVLCASVGAAETRWEPACLCLPASAGSRAASQASRRHADLPPAAVQQQQQQQGSLRRSLRSSLRSRAAAAAAAAFAAFEGAAAQQPPQHSTAWQSSTELRAALLLRAAACCCCSRRSAAVAARRFVVARRRGAPSRAPARPGSGWEKEEGGPGLSASAVIGPPGGRRQTLVL